MRKIAGLGVLLCGLLTWSIAPGDEEKTDPQPPQPAQPDPVDAGDGRSVQLTLEVGMHTSLVTRILFSPDGKQAFTVSLDKTIRVWDTETGQMLRVLRPPSSAGSGGQILNAALSKDGKLLAILALARKETGKELVGRISLIELSSGRILHTWTGTGDRRWAALAFSPDGKYLAAANSEHNKAAVCLYDTETGKKEKELDSQVRGASGIFAKAQSLAFSPDGELLAVGSAGDTGVCVFKLKGEAEKGPNKPFRFPLGGKVSLDRGSRALAWSPDGKLLAVCCPPGVRLLERDGDSFKAEGREVKGHPARFLAFSADGNRLLHSGDRDKGAPVIQHDVAKLRAGEKSKDKTLLTVPTDDNLLETGTISPDGRLLGFTGSSPHEVFIHKADGGLLHRLASRGQPIVRVAWANKGLSVAWTGTRPPKGDQPVFTHSFNLAQLEFDKPLPAEFQGQVLKGEDYSLVWEPGGHAELRRGETKKHLTSHVSCLTLVGSEYAALGHNQDVLPIQLFSIATGKGVRQLWGHTARVNTLAAKADGSYLLSGGNDQVLHIWNISEHKRLLQDKPLRPLLSLFVAGDPKQPEWVVWTQEGYYAASPGGEKLIGWATGTDPGKLMAFHPAQRFHKELYRPEVIKLVLKEGSVEAALKAAKVPKQDIEKLLPPQASLKHKQNGAEVTVEVTVAANPNTQPLTELHLLVDGRLARLGEGEVAVKTLAPTRQGATATWTVPLEPGRHKLSVRALAKDVYSISEEVSLEEVKQPAVVANNKQGTLYYVGVGVNEFKYDPELKLTGAVPDVRNMEKCLSKECAGRFAGFRGEVLTDAKATRSAILDALDGLPRKLKPTDVVIVHYSSHGEVEDDGSLYLLTHDSKRGNLKETALPGQKLRDILGQCPCQVLLILDACHSGKIPLKSSPTDPLSRLLADDSCGVAVMTAALAHQKAQDTTGGGVFTKALIDGLKGKAKPDAITKRLYVHHLFTYTFDTVASQTGYKQMPLYLPSGSVPPIVLKDGQGK